MIELIRPFNALDVALKRKDTRMANILRRAGAPPGIWRGNRKLLHEVRSARMRGNQVIDRRSQFAIVAAS